MILLLFFRYGIQQGMNVSVAQEHPISTVRISVAWSMISITTNHFKIFNIGMNISCRRLLKIKRKASPLLLLVTRWISHLISVLYAFNLSPFILPVLISNYIRLHMKKEDHSLQNLERTIHSMKPLPKQDKIQMIVFHPFSHLYYAFLSVFLTVATIALERKRSEFVHITSSPVICIRYTRHTLKTKTAKTRQFVSLFL